jgi:hypothetical protein
MFAKYKITREKADSFKKSLKMPKGVIRILKSKKNRQHNGQKGQNDKQRSTKQYT